MSRFLPAAFTCCLCLWFTSSLPAQERSKPRGPQIVLRSVKPAGSGPNVDRYGITRDDLRRIEALLPNLQSVVPVRQLSPANMRVGDRRLQVALIGTSEKYIGMVDMNLIRGRFLNARDYDQRNNVAVISRKHALRLFGREDPIGRTIHGERNVFTVVGLVESKRDLPVMIPYETMRSRLGDRAILRQSGSFETHQYEISEAYLEFEPGVDVQHASQITRAILDKYHERDDFEIGLK